MNVTFERVAFAPDHERQLAVSLQTHNAVDHVNAGLVQLARPLDVVFLVKASFQFDQRRYLFALFAARISAGGIGESGPVR